jgi:hypothetical protein
LIMGKTVNTPACCPGNPMINEMKVPMLIVRPVAIRR